MSGGDTPGVLAPPPLIYAVGLAAGLLLGIPLKSPHAPPAVTVPLGVLLVAGGLALAASFVLSFRRAGTPVDPYEPSLAVVTTGPYRYTRNPGYLGMAIVYAGIACLASAAWAFVTLVPTLYVIDRFVIRREERYLGRKFGDEYRAYLRQTRRWI